MNDGGPEEGVGEQVLSDFGISDIDFTKHKSNTHDL